MIKYVWFDWGSTLARPHTRKEFVAKPSRRLLNPDVLSLLEWLHDKMGVSIGIVSNMSGISPQEMDRALHKVGLGRYIDFTVYSSEVCSKPCRKIFQEAFSMSRENIPSLRPENVLYVGNSWEKDILGIRGAYPKAKWLYVQNDGRDIAKEISYFFYNYVI